MLLLSACSYEPVAESPQSDNRQINLICSINERVKSVSPRNSFGPGDEIGVYIANYKNGTAPELTANGNYVNNLKFSYDGGKWSSPVELYWTSAEPADAYSYRPYIAEIEDVSAVRHSVMRRQDSERSLDSLGGYDLSDFLWAKDEAVASGSTFYLNHHHLMSAINLTLVEGEGFEPGQWASLDKAISMDNIYTGAMVDLRDGSVSVDEDSDIEQIVPKRCDDGWSCIVVPQTVLPGNTLIRISVDGVPYEFKREEETIYYSGKISNFVISVNYKEKQEFEFNLISESISEWQVDESSYNRDSKAYITVTVPEFGGLQSAIDALGLKYNLISNLKVVGYCNDYDLQFINNNLRCLEALNLKNAILKNDEIPNYALEQGWRTEESMLKYVVFPDKLSKIGYGAFLYTPLSQKLFFPEGLTYIDDRAFEGIKYYSSGFFTSEHNNSNITGVSFPNSLKHIGKRAFVDAAISHDLVLPEGIEYIGETAFANCRYITGNIHVPAKIKRVNNRTFATLLSTSGVLDIPATVEEIGMGAFSSCGFDGLILHEGLKTIEEAAFAGVLFINSYNHLFPDEYILDDIFYGYYGDNPHPYGGELVVPNSVQYIGKRAFANTAFTHAYLPDNFQELPEGLFEYCYDLVDTVRVQSKVTHLSARVFRNCEKLTAIVLPEKLESISERCFENCYNLDYIQCLSPIPPTLEGYGHFDGVAKDNFTLVVPKGCVDAYRNAPGWSEFKRISEYRNFVARPQYARLMNKSNTRAVVLNADGAWSATHVPNWVHISQSSGIKKTELNITIDDLDRGSGSRLDSIVFKLDAENITTCYKIEQIDSKYSEDEQQILQKAQKGKGINIVLVGDGYDAADIANGLYEKDMNDAMESFFDVEPYHTYREYFNVYTVYAMSYESGIGTLNTLRNVKFGSSGTSDGRLGLISDRVLYYCIDNTELTESDIPDLTCAVIENTDVYDGLTYMYGNNAAVSLCTKSGSEYPFDARGVIQHEVGGHAFGKLADEYIYHYAFIQTCPCPCCNHVPELEEMHDAGWGYNIWLNGSFKAVPWGHLIADNRYNDIVDIYEGGFFHKRGVFRSEYDSCMNDNVPYFSTWSRELIVKRILSLAGEDFTYEDFVAKDSREWGVSSTKAKSENTDVHHAPKEGRAPVILRNPVRFR